MTETVPPWLQTMRDITGTKEVQGAADSPVIMAWRDEIARRYPDMAAYCAQYIHDSIAWCGLTMAYCMAKNGIKPVKEFLWADNWRKFGTKLNKPRLGCILTFKRTGGNHVAFYEGEEGSNYIIRGGNQSDAVTLMRKAKSECTGMVWPTETATQQPTKPIDATFLSLTAGGYFSSTPFDKSIPASIRTNNPGALNIAAWIKEAPGYVGDKVTSMSGASPNSTVIFSAPEYGVAAWYKLMEKYRAAGAVTVGQIINRYGGGQDYSAYVEKVSDWSGLDEDDEIVLDANDQLLAFARAMFRYEAGRETPLTNLQILKGFDIGRGKSVPIPSPSDKEPGKDATKQGIFAGLLAALGAALYGLWIWALEHPVWAILATAALVAVLWFAGHWAWNWWKNKPTANVAPEMPVPENSVPDLAQSPPTDWLDQAERQLGPRPSDPERARMEGLAAVKRAMKPKPKSAARRKPAKKLNRRATAAPRKRVPGAKAGKRKHKS